MRVISDLLLGMADFAILDGIRGSLKSDGLEVIFREF